MTGNQLSEAMKSETETIIETAKEIDNGRDLDSIMDHLKGEIEELQEEINHSNRGEAAGDDGILGEAVDVIICAVDLIHEENPDVTPEEIAEVLTEKLEKWKRIYS